MAMRALATSLNRSWWILAAVFLASGSFLLLIPVVIWRSGGGISAFVLRFGALGIHGLSWMFLGLAVAGGPRPALASAPYILSIVSFVAGVATVGIALPQRTGGIFNLRLGDRLLWDSFFPYIPSVFAPVVAAHATAFLITARSSRGWPRFRRIVLGSSILFLIAGLAIAVQIAGRFGGIAYSLAGLTGFGYAVVAWGLGFDSTPPTPSPLRT